MKIVQSQSRTSGNSHFGLPFQGNGFVTKKIFETSFLEILGDEAQVGRFETCSNEQNNVGMVKLGKESHLCSEGQQTLFIHRGLLDELFYCHIDSFPSRLEHNSIA